MTLTLSCSPASASSTSRTTAQIRCARCPAHGPSSNSPTKSRGGFYQRLGEHPNLVKVVEMDQHGIWLERAAHSCLRQYYMEGGEATLQERLGCDLSFRCRTLNRTQAQKSTEAAARGFACTHSDVWPCRNISARQSGYSCQHITG